MAIFKSHGKHAKGADDAVQNEQSEQAANSEEVTEQPAEGEEPTADAEQETTETQEETASEDAPASDQETVAIGAGVSAEADAEDENADPMAGFDVDSEGYPLNGEPADSSAFVAAGFELPQKKRRRALKAFGITMGVIIGVLLVAYIAGAVVFMGRFLPNTVMGAHDVSLKTDDEVAQIINDSVANYQLDVVGGSFSYRTTGSQINLKADSATIIAAMHEDQNPWMWPALLFTPTHDESERLVVTFDRSKLTGDFTEKVKSFNEQATPPTNATIAYKEAAKSFEVVPEKNGTQINPDAAAALVDQAVPRLETKLNLSESELIQPTVRSTDEKLIESAQVATGLVSADVKLIMGGKQVGEVNGESLSGFITVNEDYEVTMDDEALDEWVEELADSYSTKGTERHYTRPDGKEISVSDGEYGWDVDSDQLRDDLLDAIKSGTSTSIDVPCWQEAAEFNGPGERDWGNRYIDVDLSEQHVYMYDDDASLIWESDCISGAPDGTHNTGLGVWYINNKESPSKLIGYENGKKIYETMVTYWMAFEYSGIGLHDATWQPAFGGSMYANGYGSHGCVNLPYSAAAELYDITEIGDPVIVHW